jgi:ribonuclease-3
MDAQLSNLEASLGHQFANRDYLIRALTHRSHAQEPSFLETTQQTVDPGDNERLEFLGDAVLGLVVGENLFQAHPGWHEGELTRVRAQLVSRKHMAEVAVAIGLGSHLRLSRGEDRGGLRNKSTVLSNCMEAVLGALFLDAGLDPVRAFVLKYVMGPAAERLAQELLSGNALGNYKSALQELLQASHSGRPLYRIKEESGPDHRKRFLVEVVLINSEENKQIRSLAYGLGTTKKLAEQDAARLALRVLKDQASEVRSQGYEGSRKVKAPE